jgi:hypothetical protein
MGKRIGGTRGGAGMAVWYLLVQLFGLRESVVYLGGVGCWNALREDSNSS